MEISAEEMAQYRATARRREAKRRAARAARHKRAWEVARKAARLLKEEFGATRVVAFGSLLHSEVFGEWSDIDLAAWDLEGLEYFRAVARLQDIDPEFEIDLVDIDHCRPSLREHILQEGVDL